MPRLIDIKEISDKTGIPESAIEDAAIEVYWMVSGLRMGKKSMYAVFNTQVRRVVENTNVLITEEISKYLESIEK